MTQIDPKREACPCTVCRSDAAYIVPCLREKQKKG